MYLHANKAEIYFEVIGRGPIPVFFLNGVLGNAALIKTAGIPEILGENFTCVVHNYRGQDFTRFDGDFSFADLMADLWALQEKCEFAKINLVGDAFGASLALAYAYDYPECVDRMVLSAGASMKDANLAYKMASWVKVLEKTDLDTLYDVLFPDFFTPEFVEKNISKLLEWKETLIGKKGKKEILQFLGALMGRGAGRDYARLLHPALVLQGKDDAIIKPYHGQNLARLLRNASYREAEGAHVLLLEKSRWYAGQIRDFFLKEGKAEEEEGKGETSHV